MSQAGSGPPGGLLPGAFPILEFDTDPHAVIDPAVHLCGFGGPESAGKVEMPPRVVACFFGDVVAHVAEDHNARVITDLVSEHGRHAVWEIEVEGERIAFFQPGVGAPLAAFFLEEVIEYGARAIVACGAAGALVPQLEMGHPVVVTGAVRDEGTSYHYLPAAREVIADPDVVNVIARLLRDQGLAYTPGITWTTDAPYRETAARVAARRGEGCITVEMEAAALIAVARWRGVRFGQLLYAGDAVGGIEWESRGWTEASEVRERLFWLAVRACAAL
jgi:uridine phosphorylase